MPQMERVAETPAVKEPEAAKTRRHHEYDADDDADATPLFPRRPRRPPPRFCEAGSAWRGLPVAGFTHDKRHHLPRHVVVEVAADDDDDCAGNFRDYSGSRAPALRDYEGDDDDGFRGQKEEARSFFGRRKSIVHQRNSYRRFLKRRCGRKRWNRGGTKGRTGKGRGWKASRFETKSKTKESRTKVDRKTRSASEAEWASGVGSRGDRVALSAGFHQRTNRARKSFVSSRPSKTAGRRLRRHVDLFASFHHLDRKLSLRNFPPFRDPSPFIGPYPRLAFFAPSLSPCPLSPTVSSSPPFSWTCSFLLILCLLATSCGACSRRPTYTLNDGAGKPDKNVSERDVSGGGGAWVSSSSSTSPTTTMATTTTLTPGRPADPENECPVPYKKDYCLNAGVCFIIDFPPGCLRDGDAPCMKNCLCQRGWAGTRCQDRALEDPLIAGGGGGGGGGKTDQTKDDSKAKTTRVSPVEALSSTKPTGNEDDDDDLVINERLCDNKPCDSDKEKLRKGM